MVWNLAGQIAPIAVALLTVPLLLRELGVQRFGFISLAWALIGYAGLFDFGLGRALTRVLALELSRGDRDSAVRAGRTGTWLMLLAGTSIGSVLLAAAPFLVDRLLQMPPDLRGEATGALRVLAISLPVVLLTTALRGVLEAVQAFPRLNLIRMVMGLLSYVGPLLCAFVLPRLEIVVAAVVVMRVVGAWMHLRACRIELAAMLRLALPERGLLKALLAVGGWISVSNFVSPLLTYLDRFIIARQLPIEQVAYYATPYDLLMRTMVLPYALMAVIFPLLAGRAGQAQALAQLYGSSVRMLWVLMWPLCFTAMVLAEPLLGWWLGVDFARAGAAVVPALAFGLFVNTLAQAPANLIQASGSPRRMALLHLAELPVFLLALWYLVAADGIRGAALAWAGRMAFDAAALFVLARRDLPGGGLPLRWWLQAGTFCGVSAMVGLLAHPGWRLLIVWIGCLAAFTAFAWFWLLQDEDRKWIRARPALQRWSRH